MLGFPTLFLHGVGDSEGLGAKPEALHEAGDGGVEVGGALLSPLLVPGDLQVPQLLRQPLPDGLDHVESELVGYQLCDLHEPLHHQSLEPDPVKPWRKMISR